MSFIIRPPLESSSHLSCSYEKFIKNYLERNKGMNISELFIMLQAYDKELNEDIDLLDDVG
jgi:hypothetical protein